MGVLRNIAATMIGTRVAAEAKNTGLFGVLAGLAVTRVMARSPMGALVIGGGYIAHKLLQKKQKIDLVGPEDAAADDGLSAGKDAIAALPAAPPAAKPAPKPPRRHTPPASGPAPRKTPRKTASPAKPD